MSIKKVKNMDKTIFPCVIGLGYVGLPVFTRLNKVYKTVGYDINAERISLLQKKIDLTNEVKKKDLKLLNKSVITKKKRSLKKLQFFYCYCSYSANKKKDT